MIIIFADGASSGNPGPGGWGSIIVNKNDAEGHVHELGGAKAGVTNNQMELTAAGHALRHIEKTSGAVKVHTDSKYVIEGITKFIKGWLKNGWKTKVGGDVANQVYWQRLYEITEARARDFGADGKIEWVYVPGHSGIVGNERADEIAQAFSKGKQPALYSGPFKSYKVNILDGIDRLDEIKSVIKQGKNDKPYYLSLVGGKLERHETWKECEARVKGAPSPKFKKCSNKLQEAAILKEWGVAE